MRQFVLFALMHFPQLFGWWHFHAGTFAIEYAWSHCFPLVGGANALCAAKSCHLVICHRGRQRVATAVRREVLMGPLSSNVTTARVYRIVGALVKENSVGFFLKKDLGASRVRGHALRVGSVPRGYNLK